MFAFAVYSNSVRLPKVYYLLLFIIIYYYSLIFKDFALICMKTFGVTDSYFINVETVKWVYIIASCISFFSV